jgi:RNA polymerase sigma factor (sigma-70 family)
VFPRGAKPKLKGKTMNICPERMRELETIMANSNKIAKAYASKFGNRKYIPFREFLDNRCKNKALVAKFATAFANCADMQIMRAVHTVQNEIVEGYTNLAYSIAGKLGKKYRVDVNDLFSEGCLALYKAVYGYTDTQIKFITYAEHVLRRELKRLIFFNRKDSINSQSGNYEKLYRKWKKAEKELALVEIKPTYHNIVEHLKLSKREAVKMQGIIASFTSIENSRKEKNTFANNDCDLKLLVDLDFVKFSIQSREFSDLERKVFLDRLDEKSYEEIAFSIQGTQADVEKILKRISKKMHKILSDSIVQAA